MKKFAFLLLFLLPLVSCVNRQGADQVESIKDSLTRVVAAKDSMINEVFASMNAVAENLNAIKVREKIINKNIDNGEIRNQTPTQINEDVDQPTAVAEPRDDRPVAAVGQSTQESEYQYREHGEVDRTAPAAGGDQGSGDRHAEKQPRTDACAGR